MIQKIMRVIYQFTGLLTEHFDYKKVVIKQNKEDYVNRHIFLTSLTSN